MEIGIERYEELLDSGAADLAIGRLNLPDRLHSQPIHVGPYVVVASVASRYVARDGMGEPAISMADYLAAKHVHVMPRGASGDPVADALGERVALRHVSLSIPHVLALPAIIANTDMIATVPKVSADLLVAGGGLQQVPTPFPVVQSIVKQWWHRRNQNDPGHRWLRQLFATARD